MYYSISYICHKSLFVLKWCYQVVLLNDIVFHHVCKPLYYYLANIISLPIYYLAIFKNDVAGSVGVYQKWWKNVTKAGRGSINIVTSLILFFILILFLHIYKSEALLSLVSLFYVSMSIKNFQMTLLLIVAYYPLAC